MFSYYLFFLTFDEYSDLKSQYVYYSSSINNHDWVQIYHFEE